jgi:endonuclease YncB( thermonuclease family)
VSPEGWPLVDGRIKRLEGIAAVASSQRERISQWLQQSGNHLDCEPNPNTLLFRCYTRDKRDLAEVLLLNGIATADITAQANYRDAMVSAMQAKRGLWKTEH